MLKMLQHCELPCCKPQTRCWRMADRAGSAGHAPGLAAASPELAAWTEAASGWDCGLKAAPAADGACTPTCVGTTAPEHSSLACAQAQLSVHRRKGKGRCRALAGCAPL